MEKGVIKLLALIIDRNSGDLVDLHFTYNQTYLASGDDKM
jgi:hypothetical protein